MSETQITYPVWNSHHDLSWLDQRQISELPQLFSEFLLDKLGSPFLLFRIRNDIIHILSRLPVNVTTQPLVEIDVCLSDAAGKYLEAKTDVTLYEIGIWFTNQFSSSRFHEKIKKKVPNTVVHLWQSSNVVNGDYKINLPWLDFKKIDTNTNLSLVLPPYQNEIKKHEIVIHHDADKITEFGIDELSKLLGLDTERAVKRYPLVAHNHLEVASTGSLNGIERLWVRHHAYHETWKISENLKEWDAIARDAWIPILKGNVLVLGRAIPIPDPNGLPTEKQMIIVPGSLLLKVI